MVEGAYLSILQRIMMCGAALRLLEGSQGGGTEPFLPMSVTWEVAGQGWGVLFVGSKVPVPSWGPNF